MLQTTHSDDPNVQEKIDKLAKRDRKTEQFFHWALKIMEWIIAGITLIALVGALGIEVVNMVTEGTAYFADVSHMLHNLLSIVVGLEFVRMLIDTTPAWRCVSPSAASWCAAVSLVRKWWSLNRMQKQPRRPAGLLTKRKSWGIV